MPGASHTADQINEFNIVLAKFSSIDILFDDEIKTLILLTSLPGRSDVMVTAVSNSTSFEKSKFTDVRDLILSENVRKREPTTTSTSIMNMEVRSCSGWRSERAQFSLCRSKSGSRGYHKVSCSNCGKEDHLHGNCKALKRRTKTVGEHSNGKQEVLQASSQPSLKVWVFVTAYKPMMVLKALLQDGG